MAKDYADTDMGLNESKLRTTSNALQRRRAYGEWLEQNPQVSQAFNAVVPALGFFVSTFFADEAAKNCRANRHAVKGNSAAREVNLLQYKAFRKIAAITRSHPAAN